MIEAERVTRTFGRRTALAGVGFRVEPGESVLLAGPNGAGKTTLLRILAGFAPATSGWVRIAGCDVFDESESARAVLGYVPENMPLYEDMRVAEYLRFRGRLRKLPRRLLRRRLQEVSEQFELASVRGELIGALAKGQRARVALADATLHEPRVLLLDEPLAALDAQQRANVLRLLVEIRKSATVLMATHFPDEASGLFSRVLLLRAGQLLRDTVLPPRGESQPSLQARLSQWLSSPGPEAPMDAGTDAAPRQRREGAPWAR